MSFFDGSCRLGSSSFIALNSLHEHKLDLQALVTCKDFEKALKLAKAREVKLIVLDESFWKNCSMVMKIMTPVLRLLRICDSNEKPSLGFVYEGMDRVIKDIKEVFENKEDLYMRYTTIINSRWDNMLRKSLHSAAYWLNSMFQFDEDNKDALRAAFRGVLDLIGKKKSEDPITLTSQLFKFCDRVGDFGRPMAVASCKALCPDEWWKLFGGEAPELQRFAVRILSQTSSSSGCERNWSVFERIHTKRKNRLEHQRLIDLVYVHYNLRLQNRNKGNTMSYGPLDYENIDKTDIWVVNEEAEGELDYDELESMLDEEPPKTSVPSTSGCGSHIDISCKGSP
uniref:uncharacterized protein LOC122604472 n=1 Tax=Erigeron canadensis TaxID=72917 RepID=UPI001CB902F4|nr:uncharacterized protein LOC122604472 [Erigeron canadensis]